MHLSDILIIIRGAGAIGTGVAYRLYRAGFTVMLTELAQPRALQRGAAFAEAVYSGSATVEGATARLAPDPMDGMAYSVMGEIPIVVDEAGDVVARMQPRIVIDARLAGRNLDSRQRQAPLVVGLGPGFTAGKDCHVIVDTQPGENLARVYWEGALEAEPAAPGAGEVLAERDGVFQPICEIGDVVPAEAELGRVDGEPVVAPVAGVVAGLLHAEVPVSLGQVVATVDPSGDPDRPFLISARARAIGGAVLEAVLTGMPLWQLEPPPERDIL